MRELAFAVAVQPEKEIGAARGSGCQVRLDAMLRCCVLSHLADVRAEEVGRIAVVGAGKVQRMAVPQHARHRHRANAARGGEEAVEIMQSAHWG